MLTKEIQDNKKCLFCASDYHLEMILLPYIVEEIENKRITILTQKDLEQSIKIVLDKINIDEKLKEKILNLNWNKKEFKKIENEKEEIIIINGDYEFIIETNRRINDVKAEIIDCYHIGDINVDIEKLSQNYKQILNTRKI